MKKLLLLIIAFFLLVSANGQILRYSNYTVPAVPDTTSYKGVIADGNTFGWYVFDDASTKQSAGTVYQWRDLTLGNGIDDTEIFGNGDFSSDTDWTVGTGWAIGSGVATGSSEGSTGTLSKSSFTAYTVYSISFTVNSIATSYVQVSGVSPTTTRNSTGTYTEEMAASGTGVGITKAATTVCEIDNLTAYRVLGNHLVVSSTGMRPTYSEGNYIEFNGTDDYMRTRSTLSSLGTVYIVGQRVGTDDSIVLLHSLTGVGASGASALYIGRNASTTYYNVRIKEIIIRTVADSAEDIAIIDSYLNNKYSL